MSRLHTHPESHLVSRIGWLRAAVLGANDGIVSTASVAMPLAPDYSVRPDGAFHQWRKDRSTQIVVDRSGS
ncbi:hypothetical protein ABIE69_003024 [Rhodobacteraceae bacterium MBR-64]